MFALSTKRLLLLSLSLLQLSSASAVLAQGHGMSLRALGPLDTNAKRFAAGLPPLPIARRRPTKTHTPEKRTTSAVSFTGVIAVKTFSGTTLGYLSSALNSAGGYTISTILQATEVSFTAASSGFTSFIKIKDVSNNFPNTPYIGGVVPSGTSLGTGAARLAGTQATVASTTPLVGGFSTLASGGDVESAVWSYSVSSKALTLQWYNYDGSITGAGFIYDPV
ncbi:hypothetical protein C8R46DRAFT_1268525 [Mycena filopes]|nr:hypothetical protein C8R46DRAFT_1268525 [Mycena filopes]